MASCDAKPLQEFLKAFSIVIARDSEESPLLKVFSISQSGEGPVPRPPLSAPDGTARGKVDGRCDET